MKTIYICLLCDEKLKKPPIEGIDVSFFCCAECLSDYENNLKFEFNKNPKQFETRLKELDIEN